MSEFRAGAPFIMAETTIIPVEKVSVFSDKTNYGCWLHCYKEPAAIVVCNEDGIRAVDMEAKELELSELFEKTPELEKRLSGLVR
ncbi:MAG: hypothetical protein IME96_01305 [Proteobacteria bacterium]|nr:hypothetical protein [Pseudomonadota bacterium]